MSFFVMTATAATIGIYFSITFLQSVCSSFLMTLMKLTMTKTVAAMLHISGDNMNKEEFFALLDSLNENQIEGYKNIYMYTADGETSYIKIKIVYDTDYMLGFVQDVTQIVEAHSHKDDMKEYDTLTGMYTRDYFIRRVRSMLSGISGTAQCCMAAIHINGIERVDSELNYDKTALCVATAANALKRFTSENVIIGVKSYKDFLVFFRQMSKDEINDIIKKMYDAVRRCKLMDDSAILSKPAVKLLR